MKKILIIICFSLILSGCATIRLNNPENMTDAQIHKRLGGLYVSHKSQLRQELVNRHPEWSEAIKNNILKGSVSLGMTQEQFLASWGYPRDINRTVRARETKEQWVYGTFPDSEYFYFENDILTSWQD